MICLKARLSAMMSGRSSALRMTRSRPASLAFSASRSQQLLTTLAGANGSGVISKSPVSIFDMSRMPFTTASRWLPESLMSCAYSLAARRIEAHLLLVHQHLGKADDRIERRAQFVAHGGEETRLGRIGALGFGARLVERLFLMLAIGDVAHHRDHFASIALVGAVERPAAHLDPDELDRGVRLALRTLDPEFHRLRLALARPHSPSAVKIGRAIGDMHAIEQAVAHQFAHRARRTGSRAAGETNNTAPFLP